MSKIDRWPYFAGFLLAVTIALFPSFASGDDSLRLSILDLPRFQAEEGQVVALIRSKQLDKAEALLRAMTKRYPKSPTVQYNLACVLSLAGRADEAFAILDKAVEFGFRKVDHVKEDTDLINLRKDARFAALLKVAAEPLEDQVWPQFDKASPASAETERLS